MKSLVLQVFMICVSGICYSQKTSDTILYDVERFNRERAAMSHEIPEKAVSYFSDGADYFIARGDTLNYLYCRVYLSDIKHRTGDFNEAFDLLWEVLPMAEGISSKMPLLEMYEMLGILYAVYGKDSIALDYTKRGLQIAKEYAHMGKSYYSRMISCYLDVAVQLVAMEAYSAAIGYLDSCYVLNPSDSRLYFVDAVYGQVYLEMHDYERSREYFEGVLSFLEGRGNGFQAAVSYYLGDLKCAFGELDSAVFYFRKSLRAIDSLQTHLKLKPVVLEELAAVYYQLQYKEKAYVYMRKSKILSDSLFHTQSEQNRTLFEIKNRYREDLVSKQELIDSQSEMLQLGNQSRLRLKVLIVLLVIVVIIVAIAIGQRVKMRRSVYEKKLDDEKKAAILEVKNKELTANALQIVEKEQAVNELMEALRVKSPETHRVLSRKYKQSSKKIWKDFNIRFTQTNDVFYRTLLELYPELTATDLKHCALVKLNFDSKEMSHLLGISVNSVHMARSRIRKKLHLKREDNLSVFLNSL